MSVNTSAETISTSPRPQPPKLDPRDKLLFGKREAAAMLSIGVRTLDRLLAAGRIRHKRIGKKILISSVELEKFARTGDVPTRPAEASES